MKIEEEGGSPPHHGLTQHGAPLHMQHRRPSRATALTQRRDGKRGVFYLISPPKAMNNASARRAECREGCVPLIYFVYGLPPAMGIRLGRT